MKPDKNTEKKPVDKTKEEEANGVYRPLVDNDTTFNLKEITMKRAERYDLLLAGSLGTKEEDRKDFLKQHGKTEEEVPQDLNYRDFTFKMCELIFHGFSEEKYKQYDLRTAVIARARANFIYGG